MFSTPHIALMKVMPSKVSPMNPKHTQEVNRHTNEKEELFSQFDQSELDEWESLGFFVSPETLDFGYDGR